MRGVVIMKLINRNKLVTVMALLLTLVISGCSVTPDILAPEPVSAPVVEEATTVAVVKEESPAEETEETDINDVIIVTEDYPPYNFVNAEGKLDGIGYVQVKEGLDKLGADIEIQVLPWSRAYEMAQNDDNVLIFSMTRSKPRETMFKWISPLARQDVYLYALKEKASDIKISNLEEAKNYMISAMNEDYTHQSLLAAGFEEGVNISATPDMKMAATQVFKGQTDVFISGSSIEDIAELIKGTEYKADDLTIVYSVEEMTSFMYIAASPGTSDEIVEKFKEAIPGIETN